MKPCVVPSSSLLALILLAGCVLQFSDGEDSELAVRQCCHPFNRDWETALLEGVERLSESRDVHRARAGYLLNQVRAKEAAAAREEPDPG